MRIPDGAERRSWKVRGIEKNQNEGNRRIYETEQAMALLFRQYDGAKVTEREVVD